MNSVRRLIFYLASAVGAWLLLSFAGAMVDSGNAAFWSSSLMWALLSSLVLAPVLLMVNDVFSGSDEAESTAPPSPSTEVDEQEPPFVEDEPGELNKLWPEPESKPDQDDEWPPREAFQTQERVHS